MRTNRYFRRILLPVVAIICIVLLWAFFNSRDRTPKYQLALRIDPPEVPSLKVGFAKVNITPQLLDRWKDANGDAQFDQSDGDSWEDVNKNGRFDAVWMAGFQHKKPAQGIHDSLWARCVVIDDGKTRIALVALDLIGIGHDEVVTIRQHIPDAVGITYAIITSTHTHHGPDVIGLWGQNRFFSGVDFDYVQTVRQATVKAIQMAAERLRPALLQLATDSVYAISMVADTRLPQVRDKYLHIIRAVDAQADTTLGTLLCWSNHPETLWSGNLLISSDFAHYWRHYVENGIYHNDSLLVKGLGGIAIFFTGAIGGLMTTHPEVAIQDPFTGKLVTHGSPEKIEAQGKQLALITLRALDSAAGSKENYLQNAGITLRAKTIELPLYNKYYKLAVALGVIDRGYSRWSHFRTEVAYLEIGKAISFLCVPGEIYPEIIDGGIESPEGQDFSLAPQEIPPLRTLMKGKQRIILGLANDEIGYIIPKSQWDADAPYTYGYQQAPYGEINSTGPETAPLLHRALKEVITGVK
ncbi:MAG: neutral/alkaline non-lysosomal ceramidase N-terminal domain-containing protein [Cytophagales bacterium]|nr:neutral/alkaline non-lysosomal ceramidase N-terminal domain-containing protein [Bernardetiaceae bacterium]MDW8211136.1 neutral/alkaline non-lysosomal ceramidase N-terminal domain-containing protein [Cytophagales bacterium]